MSTISVRDIVGEVVARRPVLAYAFEEAGVDYCCGGKKTLEEVCREKGVDPQEFVAKIEQSAASAEEESIVDAAAMSLTELADHIEQTHHAYLCDELPRLDALTQKVASVHGGEDARLHEVRKVLFSLSAEMASHMKKEERILFPMIRQLETSDALPEFHCGAIANPIRQMEMEHHDAGAALHQMRILTDNYMPPDWACNTYRVLLDGLRQLELDMHQHVHKEDNVLFPRAIKRQVEIAESGKD